jgi:phosphopantothenate synthetase
MNDDIRALLADARRLIGQQDVALRVDAENLETVYVSEQNGELLAHDRGETFMYLVGERDPTYQAWSADSARSALEGLAVAVVGESDDDEASYQIQAVITDSTGIAAVVAMIAEAIDRVFHAHLRGDLR